MLIRFLQRGDTVIEVLIAITIFSLVAIGGMSIMNQGTNTAQRAVEITLVRQQIDAQAEALRAIHQAASRGQTAAKDEWNDITSGVGIPDSYNSSDCPDPAAISSLDGVFALNTVTAEELGSGWYESPTSPAAPPYAQYVAASGQAFGIWIEPSAQDLSVLETPGAYTFRIRACWQGAGLPTPMRLETVVRLYEI